MTRPLLAEIYADAAELMKEDPEAAQEMLAEIDVLSWLTWIAMKTEKNDPLEWRDHLPLVDIHNEWHPRQVYRKAAQIGMTGTAINKILWYGNYHNVTMIYTMPTADDVYKFSHGRFAPVIRNNFYLRKRMKNIDNATQKQIGNSWVYFRGAQKDTQAISVPADGLVTDEFDFSNQDVLDTFRKRLTASKNPFEWNFSTPTLPDYGIDALFKQTDQRFFLIKCERCNYWNNLNFWKNTFYQTVRKKYIFGCSKCKKPLNRHNGVWVAKYPERATDAVYEQRGHNKDGSPKYKLVEAASGTRGYFVNPLTFTFVKAGTLFAEWERADKSGRPSAVKNFYNFNLGVPYVSGESLITDQAIRSHMQQEYDPAGFNVFGCDQGDVLHWVVKHIAPSGARATIAFGKVTSFGEAWQKFIEWNCRVGIIDALPNKHPARALVQKSHKRLYMAYYKEQNEATKERVEDKKPLPGQKDRRGLYSHSKKETQTLMLDRAETLDLSAADWIDGRAYLAKSRENVDLATQEFIQQMQGLKRDVQEDNNGNPRVVWVRVGPDHYRHADNYATIAAELRMIGSSSQISSGGSINDIALPMDRGSAGLVMKDLLLPVPEMASSAPFSW